MTLKTQRIVTEGDDLLIDYDRRDGLITLSDYTFNIKVKASALDQIIKDFQKLKIKIEKMEEEESGRDE